MRNHEAICFHPPKGGTRAEESLIHEARSGQYSKRTAGGDFGLIGQLPEQPIGRIDGAAVAQRIPFHGGDEQIASMDLQLAAAMA